MLVQLPHRVTDLPVVGVDQERPAVGIGFHGVAGEMDLPHAVQGEGIQVGLRAVPEVGGGYVDVVDVQQQAASAAPGDFHEEFHFRILVPVEAEVGRGIFQQDLPAEAVLHQVHVIRDPPEGLVVVGQRQQVVEEQALMGGPGEMFADCRGFEAPHDPAETLQVVRVRAPGGADGQPDAVNGQRDLGACPVQPQVGGPAVAHVVLRVHLEPGRDPFRGQGLLVVFRLQADARVRRQSGGHVVRDAEGRPRSGGRTGRQMRREIPERVTARPRLAPRRGVPGMDQLSGRSRSSMVREPTRSPGSSNSGLSSSTPYFTQSPLGTTFQALPW